MSVKGGGWGLGLSQGLVSLVMFQTRFPLSGFGLTQTHTPSSSFPQPSSVGSSPRVSPGRYVNLTLSWHLGGLSDVGESGPGVRTRREVGSKSDVRISPVPGPMDLSVSV